MRKKQKTADLNIIEKAVLILVGLFILGVIVIIISFLWDKHQQKKTYSAALRRCRGTVYEISSSTNIDGGGQDWAISKDTGKFTYAPFGNILEYTCTLDQAKQTLVQQYHLRLSDVQISN